MRRLLLIIYIFLLATTVSADPRSIDADIIVDGPVSEVWKAWTTPEGIRSFFAQHSNIDLQPGGRYEILFSMDPPAGQRGCEGCTVLAVQPEKMLSFTWNSPPTLPDVRNQFTHVTLRFEPVAANRTRLIFHQEGWGTGGQWDQSYEYFTRAWKEIVLPRLQNHFEKLK